MERRTDDPIWRESLIDRIVHRHMMAEKASGAMFPVDREPGQ
ncbi:MAG TPA: hypothetical protein PLU87_11805 [Sedimentisphaerales bacterium]|nr:hypothetical protein [Sedimentisphaerales bacterium]HRV48385.1 hypothetical protein [Sedimentisphaerales bacterium]